MKNVVIMIAATAALIFGASRAFSAERTITLHANNTVSLREEFTQSSVDAVKAKLLDLSHHLPANAPIYLYLNTPGGSIMAGESLIDTIHGLKNPVVVVVEFAASMGYMTTQATTGARYITSNGVLMAHRAEVDVSGQIPGEADTRLTFFNKMARDLSAVAAKRTGVSLKDYQQKVLREYWVQGANAVKDNQADATVNVTCAADLNGTTDETLYTLFGPVDLEWANCPLISGPVSISLPRNDTDSAEYEDFVKTVNNMFTLSKFSIVSNSSLEANYHKYVF